MLKSSTFICRAQGERELYAPMIEVEGPSFYLSTNIFMTLCCMQLRICVNDVDVGLDWAFDYSLCLIWAIFIIMLLSFINLICGLQTKKKPYLWVGHMVRYRRVHEDYHVLCALYDACNMTPNQEKFFSMTVMLFVVIGSYFFFFFFSMY